MRNCPPHTSSAPRSTACSSASATNANSTANPIFSTASILPKAFTVFPRFTGQVLGPFLIVLGSEMLVDWLKHAYINKFNSVRPAIYGRFLDVMAYSEESASRDLAAIETMGIMNYRQSRQWAETGVGGVRSETCCLAGEPGKMPSARQMAV